MQRRARIIDPGLARVDDDPELGLGFELPAHVLVHAHFRIGIATLITGGLVVQSAGAGLGVHF